MFRLMTKKYNMKQMKKRILLMAVAVMMLIPVQLAAGNSHEGDADVLYIEELTVKSGEDFEIAVNFRNANTYSAFQCDILIPEGIEVEKDEDGEYCFSMEESRFTSKHSISSSLLGDGYIRVASYANPTKDMKGNDGALFYIKARAKENFSGEGVIWIKNIKFSTAEGVESELLNTETVINIISTVNEFAINDVTVTDCYTLQLPVELNNNSKIVSLDAELSLPDGMSFSGVELNPSRCDDSFSVTTSQNNDIINIKLASSASSAVAGSAGILFHLNLVQEPNSGSEKVVTLKNIIATTDDGGVIAIEDANCTVTFIINSYTLTYMVDGEVYETVQVKYGEEIIPIEEPVMDGYTFSGWGEIPETMPAEDVVISGVFTANETCAAPVISYSDGCLNITSETENAEIHTTITCSDADSYIGGKIELSSTYLITSYATKPKCANSELVTATLCWIAVSSDPGVTDIIEVEALPVLITCKDGEINIRGGQEGANVIVYDTNGVMIGNTTITNSNAIVNTSLAKGEAAIVNVAGKAVKVVMH